MFIKGVGIKSLLKALVNLHGEEGLHAVLGHLAPEIRAQLEPSVLAATMYPVIVSSSLQTAVYETVGAHSWRASYKLGIEAARIDFGGVYRVYLRVASYDEIWERIERAFAQYNSQGQAKWSERARGRRVGEITGVDGYNTGIWQSVAGRCAGILVMAGAKQADCDIEEPSPTRCLFRARWQH